jgi:GT2 family glycosyltransferase
MKRMTETPVISIVIPTFNRRDDIVRLLHSIVDSHYPQDKIEVIIVDNGNDAELAPIVKAIFASAAILTPQQNLYSNGARHIGAEAATGDYVFLLDDDNILEPDCLLHLVNAMEANASFGAVGPLMLDGASDTIWSAGATISTMGIPSYAYAGKQLSEVTLPGFIPNLDYFPNACMVRRSILKKVPLDDRAFPHNWAESDFCLRIIAEGYDVVCVTAAIDRHFIGYKGLLTRLGIDKTYDQAKSRILFRRRHMPKLIDWCRFWLVIFPVSTAVYVWRIAKTPDNKAKIFAAYIRGTRDGLLQPLQSP